MEDGIKYSKTSNYGMKIQKNFRGRHGGYSSLRVIFFYILFQKFLRFTRDNLEKLCYFFKRGRDMKLQAKEKKGKIVLVFTGLFFVLFFYNNALIVENSPQNIFDSIVHLVRS